MIPLVDGNERVDLWHPAFRARVAALCADPRMRGQLKVESAVRTREEQEYLFAGYIAGKPGFNLAANPTQILTPAYGLPSASGSWHMAQPDGHGYAVDFNTSGLSPDVYRALPVVAAEYRLVQTVLKPGWVPRIQPFAPAPALPEHPDRVKEWWHFQAPLDEGPLTWVPEEEDMTPEQANQLAEIHGLLKDGSSFRRQFQAVFEALDKNEYTDPVRKKAKLPTIRRLIKVD